jgi:uncharacterized membrane protein YccC
MSRAERFASFSPGLNALDAGVLTRRLRQAVPPLLFGLRLWAAVCLALHVAYWLELDNAYWAGTTAAMVCQPSLGASLRKASFRMIGTVIGAAAIVVLTACFPQSRTGFLLSLALWGVACGFIATMLRNFASYAAALAGFTAVIVAADELGATGGANGAAFMLGVTRVSEICIGIICAGIVMAGTDFGAARLRLRTQFADLSVEIAFRLIGSFLVRGPVGEDSRPVRRDLIRRVVKLDPLIDQAIGEASDLRYRSWALQIGVQGLLAALSGWRMVANHLEFLPEDQRRGEAHAVLQALPQELQPASVENEAASWAAEPLYGRQLCTVAVRALVTLQAATPSMRLLADGTAEALIGLSHALSGLMFLADSSQAVPHVPIARRHMPDLLPAAVNAMRIFMTIGVVELFWIVTAWPSGAAAVTWSAIFVIMLSSGADQAYESARIRWLGVSLAAVLGAIVKFAVLPVSQTFAGLGFALGLVLIPAGALSALSWQPAVFGAIASWVVPFIVPENQITYDTLQYYNSALAIVVGAGAATFSFRLLPSLPLSLRSRRLRVRTLRGLRRLATGRLRCTPADWENRVYSSLSEMPEHAEPLDFARLVAALSVGVEMIRLRRMAPRFGLGSDLETAFLAVARGDSAAATEYLAGVERDLAALPGHRSGSSAGLRMQGSILAMSEALHDHGAYFDTVL